MNLVIVPKDSPVTHKFYDVRDIKTFKATTEKASEILKTIDFDYCSEQSQEDPDFHFYENIVHYSCITTKRNPESVGKKEDTINLMDIESNLKSESKNLLEYKFVCFTHKGVVYSVCYDGTCYVTKPDSMTTVDKF